MNWLRTAASAYSHVTADPEWPKYEILESNKVLYYTTGGLSCKSIHEMIRFMKSDDINRLPVQLMHLQLLLAMNL